MPDPTKDFVPTVHEFADSGTAYDLSQCDDSIAMGDILVVPSEKAIAVLFQAWPIAITANRGKFDSLKPGAIHDFQKSATDKLYNRSIAYAIGEALERNWDIDPRPLLKPGSAEYDKAVEDDKAEQAARVAARKQRNLDEANEYYQF